MGPRHAGDDAAPDPDETPDDEATGAGGSDDDEKGAVAADDDTDGGFGEFDDHGFASDGADPAEEPFVDGTVGRSDLAAERDDYLEALQRVKAEFDNYRKRTDKERREMVDRASEKIVVDLLPVLDACDAAAAQGDAGVARIHGQLLEILAKDGLEVIQPVGKPFDPVVHEAVLREDGDEEPDVVLEVMRSGYTWRGRVLRAAMVKVQA